MNPASNVGWGQELAPTGACHQGGARALSLPTPDDLGPFPRVTLDSALKSLILRVISSRHRQLLEDHASGYLIWSPFRGLTGTGRNRERPDEAKLT